MKKDSLVAVVLVGIIIMVNALDLAVVSRCRGSNTLRKSSMSSVNGAAFVGGMGGGGAAILGRVPNRHPSTPTCAVTNATAGITAYRWWGWFW